MAKIDPKMFDVVTLTLEEIAPIFGTSPQKIKAAILNGTLPIGFVGTKTRSDEQDRVVIIERRLKAWLNATDLKAD